MSRGPKKLAVFLVGAVVWFSGNSDFGMLEFWDFYRMFLIFLGFFRFFLIFWIGLRIFRIFKILWEFWSLG
jgi:hypothetical protein